MCGSAMCARVMPTMSAQPSARMWRAVLGSVIRVAWNTGSPVSARTDRARSAKGAVRWPMVGISLEMPRSVLASAPMTLMKSIRPLRAWRTAISRLSSGASPPSSISLADMRMPTMKSGPTAAADLLEQLEREARAVGEAAAIAVAALVHGRRPELVGQVRGADHLEPVEPALLGPPRRVAIVAVDPADVLDLHLLGDRAVLVLADRRGRQVGQPVARVPARPAPGVRELDHQGAAMGVDAVGEGLQNRDDPVLGDVDLAERGGAVLGDAGGAAEHGQRQAALGLLLMVELVAQLRQPVLDVGGRVRRAHHAILEGQVPELEVAAAGDRRRTSRRHSGLVRHE